jgi:hypothetical protein
MRASLDELRAVLVSRRARLECLCVELEEKRAFPEEFFAEVRA